jgi:hypothetical protein
VDKDKINELIATEVMEWHWSDDWGCLVPPEQKAKPDEMWTPWTLGEEGWTRKAIEGAAVPGVTYSGIMETVRMPDWTGNIADAWKVVEWIRQNGYIIKFWSPNGGPYKGQWEVIAWKRIVSATGEDDPEMQAVFEDTEEIGTGIDMAPAATAPLAICLAALKLKGVEIE